VRKALFLTYFYFAWTFTVHAQQFYGPQEPPDRVVGFMLRSPLLFRSWTKARVESHSSFFNNDSLLFNYDKQKQELIVNDGKNVYAVDRREFNSVVFSYGDTTFTFEHVPAINAKDLFFAIVKTTGRYSLYKYIHIDNRNYAYVQYETFYIVFPFPSAKFLRLKVLDKKLVERAFALSRDSQKVENFYAMHRNEDSKELFLKHLVDYLNE
jgi:hypothetical protein